MVFVFDRIFLNRFDDRKSFAVISQNFFDFAEFVLDEYVEFAMVVHRYCRRRRGSTRIYGLVAEIIATMIGVSQRNSGGIGTFPAAISCPKAVKAAATIAHTMDLRFLLMCASRYGDVDYLSG